MELATWQHKQKWHKEIFGLLLIHYLIIPLTVLSFIGWVGYHFFGKMGLLVCYTSTFLSYFIGRFQNKYLNS